jgi:hypothetical protein
VYIIDQSGFQDDSIGTDCAMPAGINLGDCGSVTACRAPVKLEKALREASIESSPSPYSLISTTANCTEARMSKLHPELEIYLMLPSAYLAT